jgi:glycosyltransferase involved in cell wall biosynthesis
VSVVPPGIDYGSYSSASMPSAGGALRLGMAARLHPVKRHVDAIDAVRLLVAAGVPVSLSLAGEGPLLEQLRAYSDGLPLEFLGAVANVEQFYRSIDAFVLCSDHEGSPVALLEAMAAGLPCIVTHVGGIPELVTDADGKKCALMVPKRSPRALASKIADLAAAPGLRTQLGRMASSRAAFFSLDAQERAYDEIYAAMISEARFR